MLGRVAHRHRVDTHVNPDIGIDVVDFQWYNKRNMRITRMCEINPYSKIIDDRINLSDSVMVLAELPVTTFLTSFC